MAIQVATKHGQYTIEDSFAVSVNEHGDLTVRNQQAAIAAFPQDSWYWAGPPEDMKKLTGLATP